MQADTPSALALQAAERLDGWVRANGWEGYDPHDVKGTRLFMFLLQPRPSIAVRLLRRAFLYFESFFPALARKLFAVRPTINAKGMALFARAYLQLYQGTGDTAFRGRAVECLEWLLANASTGYDEPG